MHLFQTGDGKLLLSNAGKVLVFKSVESGIASEWFQLEQQHDDYAPSFESFQAERKVYGVLGVLDLHFVRYVVVVVRRRLVTCIQQATVYSVVNVECIPVYRKSYLTLAEEQHEADAVSAIKAVSTSGLLYYSQEYDLTSSVSQLQVKEQSKLNDTYCWNYNLLAPFHSHFENFQDFILPVICGYVGNLSFHHFFSPFPPSSPLSSPIMSLSSETHGCDIFLISRMQRHRVGTRYTRRGLDLQGNAAVSVESETILLTPQGPQSFTMIRGSAPWLWTHTLDLSHRPPINLEPLQSSEARRAFERHFGLLFEKYGHITGLNLLNHAGYESSLYSKYTALAAELAYRNRYQFAYFAFDMNRDVKAPQAVLFALKDTLEKDCFYSALEGNKVLNQIGVVRVNCLDCLDRTNFIQTFLAKYVLGLMFSEAGYTSKDHVDLEGKWFGELFGHDSDRAFFELWSKNGDAIATQYTGTGTIRRGHYIPGTLCREKHLFSVSDMLHSMARYYLNHFSDHIQQDNYDIFMCYHRESDIRIFAKKYQAIQRRMSFEIGQKSWAISYMLLLKKYTAPVRLSSWLNVVLASLWAIIFRIYACFGISPKILLREPKSGRGWAPDDTPLSELKINVQQQ